MSPCHLLYRKGMLRCGQIEQIGIFLDEKTAEFVVTIPDEIRLGCSGIRPEVFLFTQTILEFQKIIFTDTHPHIMQVASHEKYEYLIRIELVYLLFSYQAVA